MSVSQPMLVGAVWRASLLGGPLILVEPMPRYFFNIHGRNDVFDTLGTILINDREIRIHMMATAQAVLKDTHARCGEWDMEVLDERGSIVASMDFSVETKKT